MLCRACAAAAARPRAASEPLPLATCCAGPVQQLQHVLKQRLGQFPVTEYGEAALLLLFQAHLATRGDHHTPTLPPSLSQRCEIAWHGHLADEKPSQVLLLQPGLRPCLATGRGLYIDVWFGCCQKN